MTVVDRFWCGFSKVYIWCISSRDTKVVACYAQIIVEYLLSIITVMGLKIQKISTALLLFYHGQLGVIFASCWFKLWNASYIVYERHLECLY